MLILLHVDASNDPNVRGDAFKTLFVARLSYDTKEKDLEREFGRFGPIERVSFNYDPFFESLLAYSYVYRYALSKTNLRLSRPMRMVSMAPRKPKRVRRRRLTEATHSWFTSVKRT